MKKNINQNCWLTRNLDNAPAQRCKYCELKFHNCLFFQYLMISLSISIILIVLSYLLIGEISRLLVVSIFLFILVYGYFFNKSTDRIIKSNFEQKKAKEALAELSQNLQQKVDQQTKEIKKAYEIEKKANQELIRINEAKNQFIVATQHHLRTPLTSMMGYIDLLLTGTFGKISDKVKEILKKLEKSTKNEIKIVEELLSISQFQLGKKVVDLSSEIKIEKLLLEIINEVKPEAQEKKLYLRLKKHNLLPQIKADILKLRVALTNVIDNSIKYTQEGGIDIDLQKEQSKILIIVKDTGIGIHKGEINNLFVKTFERGEKAQKLFTTGRGIGLYISAKIIEAHNGKIWAESKGPGHGATFYIELPLAC